MRVKCVIFDWAGTAVDFGSHAPLAAFLDLFAHHGVPANANLVRRFMGSHKRDHIRLLLADPAFQAEWMRHNSLPPNLDELYAEFIPLQKAAISRHADVIDGVPQVMEELRRRGVKTGSTTGYVREMMDTLQAEAARGGFAPDAVVCSDEVPAGRPAPWMALRAAMLVNAWPISGCVKVGDTVADIDEGRNAGMWTVAVTKTGNEIGLSETETAALPAPDLEKRLEAARHKFVRAGAHYVIDSVADFVPVLDDIEARLEVGARP